jgi:hypothetical protein
VIYYDIKGCTIILEGKTVRYLSLYRLIQQSNKANSSRASQSQQEQSYVFATQNSLIILTMKKKGID